MDIGPSLAARELRRVTQRASVGLAKIVLQVLWPVLSGPLLRFPEPRSLMQFVISSTLAGWALVSDIVSPPNRRRIEQCSDWPEDQLSTRELMVTTTNVLAVKPIITKEGGRRN